MGICLLAFLTLGSYSIARPAVESLFLEAHSSESLPMAWLLVAVVALVTVSIYNRFAAKVGMVKLFAGCIAATMGVLLLLQGARGAGVPGATFLLYAWKDVYIVVLVELFWTFANSVYKLKNAKWLYGLFCVMGSVGSLAANRGSGFLIKTFESITTETMLWAMFPTLFVLALVFAWVGRGAAPPGAKKKGDDSQESFSEGFKLVLGRRYLLLMLALIALTQVVITLIDFQYNAALEAAYPETDARTAVIGEVYGYVDIGAMGLQFLAGPILGLIGVSRTLWGIPLMLGGAVGAFAVSPQFFTMAVAKVCSKVFDYSLFRIAKEMLYLPLGYREKTQGKAVIDILTYRVAKGGASVMLLGLGALSASMSPELISGIVSWTTLGLIVVWLGVVVALTRLYRRRLVASESESAEEQSA